MADTKITGLTADASPSSDDLVVTVNDPGGTPANRKVTIANLAAAIKAAQSLLADLSEDTTPQLGGNLDVNGNSIVSSSNGDIQLTPNGTGDVVLGNFTFDADATVGAGQDNYVLTYDNGTGLISLEAAPGAGGGDAWSDPVNSNITFDTDSAYSIGSGTAAAAAIHTDSLVLGGTTFTGSGLSDPGADAFIMWDDSASDNAFFTLGTGLSTSGTTVNAEVSLAGSQTLTNKTITDPTITYDVSTEAGNVTLALADRVVLMSSASANTVTIPTNASVAFAVGSVITIVSTGTGTTTIAGDTGVTLQGNGGSASAGSCDIQTQYGAASLIKIATDTWVVSGDIDAVA